MLCPVNKKGLHFLQKDRVSEMVMVRVIYTMV